jgi:hypothetical protein
MPWIGNERLNLQKLRPAICYIRHEVHDSFGRSPLWIKVRGIALAGLVLGAGRVVGDELGEVLQQVGWPADAVLCAQAGVL